jgi:hypothetical protein
MQFSPNRGQYVNHLVLKNASILDSGYYTCVGLDETKKDSVFIFVTDKSRQRHLLHFAPTEEDDGEWHKTEVSSWRDDYIGCQTSDRSAIVTLWNVDRNQEVKGPAARYDPRRGFFIGASSARKRREELGEDGSRLECRGGTEDGRNDTIKLKLVYSTDSSDSIPVVTISPKTPHRGGFLILSCLMNSDSTGQCNWTFPAASSNRTVVRNVSKDDGLLNFTLIVCDLIPEIDSGNYSCICW